MGMRDVKYILDDRIAKNKRQADRAWLEGDITKLERIQAAGNALKALRKEFRKNKFF